MRVEIIPPSKNFKGMSYADWIVIWNRWLMSEDPDAYNGRDVLFLRGNVNYRPISGISGAPRHIDPNAIYDRTGQNGETIFEGTSIFIPVLTSLFTIGHLYDGKVIKNEEELRYIVNKDTDESGAIWATIMMDGDRKPSKIVNDLKEFRAETPLFRLIVPELCLLRDLSDEPLKAGAYEAMSAGYFLMIRKLPPSNYRILFGGKGRGVYYTNAAYDITVRGTMRRSVMDRSRSAITSRYAALT
jgi:hypothetical protein